MDGARAGREGESSERGSPGGGLYRTGRRRRSTLLVLVALVLLLAPEKAEAQSSGLSWLREIERWTHKEDYRTWIGHGVVTAASTLVGHWVFGKSHYGAGAAVMFYAGVEYQELRRDDWVVHNKLDKFMDLAVPITVGGLLVTLLSEDDARNPNLIPGVDTEEEDSEDDALPPRPQHFAVTPLPNDVLLPTLPFRRGAFPETSTAGIPLITLPPIS